MGQKLRSAKGLNEHIDQTRLAWFTHQCGDACVDAGLLDAHAALKVAEEVRRQKIEDIRNAGRVVGG